MVSNIQVQVIAYVPWNTAVENLGCGRQDSFECKGSEWRQSHTARLRSPLRGEGSLRHNYSPMRHGLYSTLSLNPFNPSQHYLHIFTVYHLQWEQGSVIPTHAHNSWPHLFVFRPRWREEFSLLSATSSVLIKGLVHTHTEQ